MAGLGDSKSSEHCNKVKQNKRGNEMGCETHIRKENVQTCWVDESQGYNAEWQCVQNESSDLSSLTSSGTVLGPCKEKRQHLFRQISCQQQKTHH